MKNRSLQLSMSQAILSKTNSNLKHCLDCWEHPEPASLDFLSSIVELMNMTMTATATLLLVIHKGGPDPLPWFFQASLQFHGLVVEVVGTNDLHVLIQLCLLADDSQSCQGQLVLLQVMETQSNQISTYFVSDIRPMSFITVFCAELKSTELFHSR